MFTGIVEELGTVASIRVNEAGGRLRLQAPKVSDGLRVDESVATNGVCLTAVAVEGQQFEVDLAPETLSRTNLGQLEPGDRVCLERSVTLATRMGGHLVQGHVDGTATITAVEPEGIQRTVRFKASPDVVRYIVAKGFVALDGVSLTVVDCDASSFSIALIPHSAAMTTLGFKGVGDDVNVEVDMIAKYVERFVEAHPRGKAVAEPFASIDEALDDIRGGRMVVVCDDEDRENEGDLTMAAEKATPADIAFMAMHGRGLICVPLTEERCDHLQLRQMVSNNTATFGTAFTVSVEAKARTTTGISAFDRAATIQALIDPEVTSEDLLRPGHTFPLRAREGGVLRRAGQTEAAVDLARLAGLYPAGVICEVMKDDGTMARVPDLVEFCAKHGLKMITVRDLIEYRLGREKLVRRIAEARLPSAHGEFRVVAYCGLVDNEVHLALVHGEIDPDKPALVRVHSECLTGDVFSSLRCDCGEQLVAAMQRIGLADSGVLVYLRQEGRGIGLANKLAAYGLQDQGQDTVEANEALGFAPDLRNYGIGAQILRDVGVSRMRLMTNNPRKIVGLEGYGLEIVERLPLEMAPNDINANYLMTKRIKLGHLFDNV